MVNMSVDGISTANVCENGTLQDAYGAHLVEVRSIVLRSEIKGHGAGSLLVQALLEQAQTQ